ncbi:RPA-interacting protein [Rhineura floridana]|uniref:RPA-interacting protein n=1 Tax=Rhineura floridana TaxID=261503 RepID=UPI002AC80488|nr:RPA-interacting protein [Rhineura floridana]
MHRLPDSFSGLGFPACLGRGNGSGSSPSCERLSLLGLGLAWPPSGKERMEGLARRRRRALYKGVKAQPWKETFRQRCMERLKNSRARLLDTYRQVGGDSAHGASKALLVQEVMEVEWQALNSEDLRHSSLRSQDTFPQAAVILEDSELAEWEEIQQELILQEQLVVEEYERRLWFEEECLNAMLDGLDAESKVVCPVCRRNNLCVRNRLVVCPCGLRICTQGMTEEELSSRLEDSVMDHSQHCHCSPEFAVTSGMDGEATLLMSCQVCDSWAVIL